MNHNSQVMTVETLSRVVAIAKMGIVCMVRHVWFPKMNPHDET